MPRKITLALFIALACWCVPHKTLAALPGLADETWTTDFRLEKDELTSKGRNPYFILEPGYYLVLAGGTEQNIITVLDSTKVIDGVETRIVEERETNKGELVEISRNFFAISKRTNNVYYFGEEVDIYEHGKLAKHDGAWQSGSNGAKFGLMMPGTALLGARYYQELAPKVAMDRAEVVGLNEAVSSPAGNFKDCVKMVETTPLEKDIGQKYYVSGIGLVQDDELKLARYGYAPKATK